MQPAVTGLHRTRRQAEKVPQVADARAARRHCAEDAGQVQRPVELRQKRIHRQLGRPGAPGAQLLQKVDRFLIRLGVSLQASVQIALPPPGPGLGDLIGGKSQERACQGRVEGDVLVGIVDHLQQGDQLRNLRAGQQIALLVAGDGDAPLLQRPDIGRSDGAHRAQQDHDIPSLDPARTGGGGDISRLPQQALDALGDPGGLGIPLFRVLRLVVIGKVDAVQLHRLLGRLLQNPAAAEGLGVVIIHIAHGLAHGVAANVIRRVQDLRPGAEILGEQNAAGLPRQSLCAVGPGAVFFQENRWVRQAEAIDGLLHVADEEYIFPFPRDGEEDAVLQAVGILVFVHHDLPVALGDLPGDRRGRAAGGTEQPPGLLLKVGEIQPFAATLFLPPAGSKAAGQADQAADGPAALGLLGHRLRCRSAEEGKQTGQLLLLLLAGRLELGL